MRFLDRFEAALLDQGRTFMFETRVWSSDFGAIKPSRALFERALERLGLAAEQVVFVGDHPMREIDAAKALGCGVVWVSGDGGTAFPAGLRRPDLVVRDFVELMAV